MLVPDLHGRVIHARVRGRARACSSPLGCGVGVGGAGHSSPTPARRREPLRHGRRTARVDLNAVHYQSHTVTMDKLDSA